jgi:hypothetical protein
MNSQRTLSVALSPDSQWLAAGNEDQDGKPIELPGRRRFVCGAQAGRKPSPLESLKKSRFVSHVTHGEER